METPETETLLSGRPSASFTVRLSPLLKSKAEAKAKANGLSLAQTTRLALACYVEPRRYYPAPPPGEAEAWVDEPFQPDVAAG